MAEKKSHVIEREYVIPLRKEWTKVARYKRTAKSVKAIKEFIAKHMRVADRDLDKVRLDVYLNNEMWFRGAKTPFSKIKVKAKKEGDIVRVELADVPEYVKFLKMKHEKIHKKPSKKIEEKKEEKKEEKTDEEKKSEEEKSRASELQQSQISEQMAKTEKHLAKDKNVITHRMALKK